MRISEDTYSNKINSNKHNTQVNVTFWGQYTMDAVQNELFVNQMMPDVITSPRNKTQQVKS